VTVIEEGARARLTRDVHDLAAGTEFTVDEYLEPRPEVEREPDEIDAPHYYGSVNGGSYNLFAPADAVEQVMSAAAMQARRPPTARQLRDAISLDLLGRFADGDFVLDETDRDGERSLEVYGRTASGLPFGFRVTVSDPWETDL
jgi:hypothetical protein